MPNILKAKPDAGAMYVALESFVFAGPSGEETVKEDSHLRGTHPAVVKHPHLFAPVGLDDIELAELKHRNLDIAISRAIKGATP